MTQSRILFSVFFLSIFIFIFPLRHALNPKKCPSYYWESYLNKCEGIGISIRFPFCGHPGFNLHCNNLDKTVIELPMSGTFLVDKINYLKQQISISDPENCMVKRLLTFNTSGSPFSYRFGVYYTFLTCPNEVVIPAWSLMSIPCLSNSTSSFFATSNLTFSLSLPPSCQIVKRLDVPVEEIYKDLISEKEFSSVNMFGNVLLEWSSPNCRGCEKESLRCGFKNKASLEVKCLADPPEKTKCSPNAAAKRRCGHYGS